MAYHVTDLIALPNTAKRRSAIRSSATIAHLLAAVRVVTKPSENLSDDTWIDLRHLFVIDCQKLADFPFDKPLFELSHRVCIDDPIAHLQSWRLKQR